MIPGVITFCFRPLRQKINKIESLNYFYNVILRDIQFRLFQNRNLEKISFIFKFIFIWKAYKGTFWFIQKLKNIKKDHFERQTVYRNKQFTFLFLLNYKHKY